MPADRRDRSLAPQSAELSVLLHIVARGKIGRGARGRAGRPLPQAHRLAGEGHRAARARRPAAARRPSSASPSCSTRKARSSRSIELARRLEQWRDGGRREARFLIGGADGFDDAERAAADLLLAFGRATWPHLLARAMLAEQLFRATSILANHPYHREG